jgi:hypothetical protein
MEYDNPTRMSKAKEAAKLIIEKMKPSDRCTVIGFSRTFHNVQSLTSENLTLSSS